jgi:hypothetical protein
MHTLHRPDRRDWLAGISAGAILGLLFLGVGARAGMRLIALASGQAPLFTIEGSIAVSLLGAATGALVATIFLLVRTILPTHRWIRAALFWVVCGAIMLRGLRPVSVLNAGIFLPLFVMHGALLHAYWCRIHLPRSRHAHAGS